MNNDCSLVSQQRINACVNACAGIPTEKLEGKTIAEYVSDEAYLTGIQTVGSIDVGLKGLACQMLASSFAGQFVGSGAVNYLEVAMTHQELGDFVVTIQRREGKTPVEFRMDAEREREKLASELKNIARAKMSDFSSLDEFVAWAKNRARHTLAEVGIPVQY